MPTIHTISLADHAAHLITVRTRSVAEPGAALPDPLVLAMPVWTPGSYLVREYARCVERPRAFGEGGRELGVVKVRKNAWSIRHHGASEVTFEYELYCNDLSVRTNHVDASHVYLNGAATFTFAEHAPDEGADVVLDLPADFRVATALRLTGGSSTASVGAPRVEHHLRAQTFDELVDSPILASNHAVHSFQVLGKPHWFAVWGDAPGAKWDQLMLDTEAIIETEARLFGGELPYAEYTFLWLITAKNRGGLEHRTSTTLTVTPHLFDDRKGTLDVLSLVAHEFFHLWNVKRIRPAGLSPYRYEAENYTRLLWWFEGATSYYDWRILRMAGLCTVDEYLDHLGEELGRLEETPGRALQSACESSYDAWIKLYRADENTINSTVSYYLKGEIVCALLDIEIRSRTGGERGLDHVLALLWRDFGAVERPVPEDALPGVFEEAVGVSMIDVLEPWTEGRGELPVDDVFAKVGLRVRRDDRDNREDGRPSIKRPSMGLRTRSEGGRVTVTAVLRGRPGHRAGLDVGDEIVAVANRRLEGGKIDTALGGHVVGDHVRVLVSRDGVLREAEVVLDAQPERPRLQLAGEDGDSVSASRRALLEGWLHGAPSAPKATR